MDRKPVQPIGIGLREVGENVLGGGRHTLVTGRSYLTSRAQYSHSVPSLWENIFGTETWCGAATPDEALQDGLDVFNRLRAEFTPPVGSLLLYWIAGTLLKPEMGAWPHVELVGPRESGKTTIIRKIRYAFHIPALTSLGLSNFRMQQAFGNASLPVIIDDTHRMKASDVDLIMGTMRMAYFGDSVLVYGKDAFPVHMLGSALIAGQKPLRDTFLDGSVLSLRVERDDYCGVRDAIGVASGARWPWLQWVRRLCRVLDGNTWKKVLNESYAIVVGKFPKVERRLANSIARVLTSRVFVRSWLGLPDDHEELDAIVAMLASPPQAPTQDAERASTQQARKATQRRPVLLRFGNGAIAMRPARDHGCEFARNLVFYAVEPGPIGNVDDVGSRPSSLPAGPISLDDPRLGVVMKFDNLASAVALRDAVQDLVANWETAERGDE